MALTKLLALLAFAGLVWSTPCVASLVYSADFSIDGQGSTHDNTGGDPIESSPVVGSNWTLTYGSVSSDSTTNEFITTGGVMRVQDWGGFGSVESNVINIPLAGTLTIAGDALTIGNNPFGGSGEHISWFYLINGGATNEFFTIDDSGLSAGSDVGHTFAGIPVLPGDTVTVGFQVNVNGANAGVEVSSLTVDFVAVPEPTSVLTFGFVSTALCLTASRRRARG